MILGSDIDAMISRALALRWLWLVASVIDAVVMGM